MPHIVTMQLPHGSLEEWIFWSPDQLNMTQEKGGSACLCLDETEEQDLTYFPNYYSYFLSSNSWLSRIPDIKDNLVIR